MERQCAFLGIVRVCLANRNGLPARRLPGEKGRTLRCAHSWLTWGPKPYPNDQPPMTTTSGFTRQAQRRNPTKAEPPDAQLTVEQWLNEQAVAAWFGSKEKTTEGEAPATGRTEANERERSGTQRGCGKRS